MGNATGRCGFMGAPFCACDDSDDDNSDGTEPAGQSHRKKKRAHQSPRKSPRRKVPASQGPSAGLNLSRVNTVPTPVRPLRCDTDVHGDRFEGGRSYGSSPYDRSSSQRSPWSPGDSDHNTMTITIVTASSCGAAIEHTVGKEWTLRDIELQLASATIGEVGLRQVGSNDHIIITQEMCRDLTLSELCVYPGDTLHFMGSRLWRHTRTPSPRTRPPCVVIDDEPLSLDAC